MSLFSKEKPFQAPLLLVLELMHYWFLSQTIYVIQLKSCGSAFKGLLLFYWAFWLLLSGFPTTLIHQTLSFIFILFSYANKFYVLFHYIHKSPLWSSLDYEKSL